MHTNLVRTFRLTFNEIKVSAIHKSRLYSLIFLLLTPKLRRRYGNPRETNITYEKKKFKTRWVQYDKIYLNNVPIVFITTKVTK